jgi:hypothetical protein
MLTLTLLLVLGSVVSSAEIRHFIASNKADEVVTGAPLESFVSYSIEFSSFPDFAGKKSRHEVVCG